MTVMRSANPNQICNNAPHRSIGWTKGGLVNKAALGLALVVALSACQRTSNLNQGGVLPRPAAPANLQPAPLPPVQESTLAPAQPTAPPVPSNTTVEPTAPAVPAAPEKVEVAKVEPANSKPVTRQSLIGAWTVSTGGSNCQIFLALTKWSGGFRAASRGCSAPAIADVQAWDVRGKQVVLVNSSGSTAATLFRSSDQRYDGSTTSGVSCSFFR